MKSFLGLILVGLVLASAVSAQAIDKATAAWLAGSADGFAALNGGTTGGAGADAAHTFVVTNRAQLVAALKGAFKKIIIVKGTIDICSDENGRPLTAESFVSGKFAPNDAAAYDFKKYLAAYDPKVWNKGGSGAGTGKENGKLPSGDQERARSNAKSNQAAIVKIDVPSNTSIIGFGNDAKIIHGNLILDAGVTNIVIRNIEFQDSYDLFPGWDPTDGSQGNWNSEYDLISITGATNVWIDHCTFSDGDRPDSQNGDYYGRDYQHHDGTIDITKASDLVTISYCYTHDHDKTNLIGASDSASSDAGKLRVTMHHNVYKSIIQRQPRVRFGQIHAYNNYYFNGPASGGYYSARYQYTFGAGVNAQIYAEANYFEKDSAFVSWFDKTTAPAKVQDVKNNIPLNLGTHKSETITLQPSTVKGYTFAMPVDVAADVKKLCMEYSGAGKPIR